MLDIPGPRGEGVIPLMAYTGRLGGGGGDCHMWAI